MLDQIPHATDGFELEEIDGEILLYSPTSTRSVYLNTSASLIWRLCDGTHSVGDIVDQLVEAFPEAGDHIANDVTRSINLFVENGAMRLDSAD
jgi:hypothetical protein